MRLRIAIIGGGASGTILAINLLQTLKQEADIFLIEKDKRKLFRGAAYSSKLEYELLNVPAGKMSLSVEQPDDFYNWLQQNTDTGQEPTRSSFVSRRWFGNYLEERLLRAVTQKGEGISFRTVLSSTIKITNENSLYTLVQEDGKNIQADVVVLATGNEAPAQVIPDAVRQVLGSKYIANPWTGDEVNAIKPGEEVLIIGTGLTMVDHVLSLHKRGHTGRINALSRHGLLPKAHGVSVPYKLSSDISSADFQQFYDKLLEEIESASAQNINWISVLDALRPVTTQLWQNFSAESKRVFLEKYKTKWDIHRHRVPQASARVINEMIAVQQLQLLQGTIVGALQQNNDFSVAYRHSYTWQMEYVNAGTVINCTGPAGDYAQSNNALYKELLKAGWMKKDDLNIGIVTGTQGEIVRSNGDLLSNVYAIGPLRKASEWESTAIPEIRKQAAQLAKLVAENNKEAVGVLVRSR